ncbi:MAG: MarR family transcriptional regulator [Actinobacteria bacterium]|nr:MAG: MarR family transcriptional regulator [Actinomycetota bacterium]
MSIQADAKADAPVREAWGLLWELMLSNRHRFVARLLELDLTPVQGITLRRLDPERPVPMHELAAALSCDASNVTGIVDRLEARGALERRSDPRDRRIKALVLTPDGVELRLRVVGLMDEPPPEIAALSHQDQLTLCRIMRRAKQAAVDGAQA